MFNALIYGLSIFISIFLYVLVYCGMNKHNCYNNKKIDLPIGKEMIAPFQELINGRYTLFFTMMFSINTPWLFIIIGLVGCAIYINFFAKQTIIKDKDD